MSSRLRLPNTPLKPESASRRASTSIPSSAKSNFNHIGGQNIVSKTAHGRAHRPPSARLQTQPLSDKLSAHLPPKRKAIAGCSPSLKTQKRQYLKLFTTASTNQQNQSQQASNQRVHTSNQSAPLHYHSQQNPKRAIPIRVAPRRKLFGDIVIEQEQRIILDDNQSQREAADKHKNNPFPHHLKTERLDSGNADSLNGLLIPGVGTLNEQGSLAFQRILSASPGGRVELMRQTGLELIRRIQERSGQVEGVAGHCGSFLRECELAWSAGRPSDIYNFKLATLQSTTAKLAACMADIHALNLLLQMRHQMHQQTHHSTH